MGCFGGSQRWEATTDDYTLFIGIMGSGRRSLRENILVGGGYWVHFGRFPVITMVLSSGRDE